ncbi:MAG: hypothetical protein H6741_09235 [Alphaproteobacteria bacterium]|nr:hypothetical protein [Alphaproteobacteria bacterium]MCB9792897.1 hypothetical protein [Alphaproteobacteria bacterium]
MRFTFTLLGLAALTACGGEVPQTEACAAYVACVEARDLELGIRTNLDRFEPGGACWGSAEGGALCDRGCSSGLAWMQDAYADLPEACDP